MIKALQANSSSGKKVILDAYIKELKETSPKKKKEELERSVKTKPLVQKVQNDQINRMLT